MPSGFKCKCDLWAWQAALDKEPPPSPLLWHLGSSGCASPALEDVCTQIKCGSSHAKLHLQSASCNVHRATAADTATLPHGRGNKCSRPKVYLLPAPLEQSSTAPTRGQVFSKDCDTSRRPICCSPSRTFGNVASAEVS